MGTRAGQRGKIAKAKVRFLTDQGGPVAQLLHPNWLARDDPSQIGSVLLQTEKLLSAQAPDTKLVLAGAGLLEIWLDPQDSYTDWKTAAALKRLSSQCRDVANNTLLPLRDATRDYLFGIDFVAGDRGVGQFGVLGRGGEARAIIWKSYPSGSEDNTLAGFGTTTGRLCPRVCHTNLGRVMVLICHDAQAFNHRNKALVRRAHGHTSRSAVMSEMARQMEDGQPTWVLNLIHFIDKPSSMTTFYRSFKQISTDYAWHPKVIGAFGYGKSVRPLLAALATECQFPPRTSTCVLVIEEG